MSIIECVHCDLSFSMTSFDTKIMEWYMYNTVVLFPLVNESVNSMGTFSSLSFSRQITKREILSWLNRSSSDADAMRQSE